MTSDSVPAAPAPVPDHPVHGHGHDHAHAHGHAHDHVPAVTRRNERSLLLAFWLIAVFMVVEVVGGWLSGSLALLADAGHMATDAGALALAFLAFRLGRRAADGKRTFGYLRLEVLAGFVNAITLLAIVVWILVEAWQRLQSPAVVLAGPMLWVASAGLVVNLVVLYVLTRGDREHVNLQGAVAHVVGDLLGSIAAVVAALVIQFTGWTPIDPLLSVLVALLIVRSAVALLARSVHILLEGAPAQATPARLAAQLLQSVPDLAAVRHVHVWSITSGRTLATLHVEPKRHADPRAVVRATEAILRAHFGIDHATIALDWPGDEPRCSLHQAPEGSGAACHGH